MIEERIAALKEQHEWITTERKAPTQDIKEVSLKVVEHVFRRAARPHAAC